MPSVGQSVSDSFRLAQFWGLLACFHPTSFSLNCPKHPQTQSQSVATLGGPDWRTTNYDLISSSERGHFWYKEDGGSEEPHSMFLFPPPLPFRHLFLLAGPLVLIGSTQQKAVAIIRPSRSKPNISGGGKFTALIIYEPNWKGAFLDKWKQERSVPALFHFNYRFLCSAIWYCERYQLFSFFENSWNFWC